MFKTGDIICYDEKQTGKGKWIGPKFKYIDNDGYSARVELLEDIDVVYKKGHVIRIGMHALILAKSKQCHYPKWW